MAIVLKCGCGKSIRVADSTAGKRLKCPHCAAIVEVPKAMPDEAAPSTLSDFSDLAVGETVPVAKPKVPDAPKSQPSSGGVRIGGLELPLGAVVAGSATALLVVGVLIWAIARDPAPQADPKAAARRPEPEPKKAAPIVEIEPDPLVIEPEPKTETPVAKTEPPEVAKSEPVVTKTPSEKGKAVKKSNPESETLWTYQGEGGRVLKWASVLDEGRTVCTFAHHPFTMSGPVAVFWNAKTGKRFHRVERAKGEKLDVGVWRDIAADRVLCFEYADGGYVLAVRKLSDGKPIVTTAWGKHSPGGVHTTDGRHFRVWGETVARFDAVTGALEREALPAMHWWNWHPKFGVIGMDKQGAKHWKRIEDCGDGAPVAAFTVHGRTEEFVGVWPNAEGTRLFASKVVRKSFFDTGRIVHFELDPQDFEPMNFRSGGGNSGSPDGRFVVRAGVCEDQFRNTRIGLFDMNENPPVFGGFFEDSSALISRFTAVDAPYELVRLHPQTGVQMSFDLNEAPVLAPPLPNWPAEPARGFATAKLKSVELKTLADWGGAVTNDGTLGCCWADALEIIHPLLGQTVMQLAGPKEGLSRAAATADAAVAVSAHADRSFRVWDLAGGAQVRRYAGPAEPVTSLSLQREFAIRRPGAELPVRGRLAAAVKSRFDVFSLDTGVKQHSSPAHDAALTALVIASDGSMIISADASGALRVWNAATGAEFPAFPKQSPPVRRLELTIDARFLMTLQEGGAVKFWRVNRRQVEREFASPAALDATLTDEGRAVAMICGDGTLRIRQFYDGAEVAKIEGLTGVHSHLASSETGAFLLATSREAEKSKVTLYGRP